jgi:hypothetical protein
MEEIAMTQPANELLEIQNSIDLEMDKDTWIYTYGSPQLQHVRSFDYECEERYQQERLKAEYLGFKINHHSAAKKLDFPPLYAIQESLKWDGAYVAKQYSDGEVIVIDNYLGKYQIIKKTRKPWYLIYRNLTERDVSFWGTFLGCTIGLTTWIIILIMLQPTSSRLDRKKVILDKVDLKYQK